MAAKSEGSVLDSAYDLSGFDMDVAAAVVGERPASPNAISSLGETSIAAAGDNSPLNAAMNNAQGNAEGKDQKSIPAFNSAI